MARLTTADDTVPPAVLAPAFVGRGRDLAVLENAVRTSPAIVLVEGEAGAGKSRLVQEWLSARVPPSRTPPSPPTGGGVLVSVCPPLRESLTLGPVVDAFRGLDVVSQDLRLSGLAGALRPLFPEWTDALPPAPEQLGDVHAERHRMFRALDELFQALEVDTLVLEDAHWADDVTLEFLLFTVSRQQAGGRSLVVTYRPDEVGSDSLLLRLTSRIPAGVAHARIVLRPLRQEDTTALVASMLGGKISPELAVFLYELSDGVPLALEESVRLLAERADLERSGEQWSGPRSGEALMPPTVRDLTRERVGRLSPVAVQALHAVATLAEPSSENTVATTAGLSPEVCRAGLMEAADAAVLGVDPRGRWRFRHRLVAAAVYGSITHVDRAALHARAGRALEAVVPQPVDRLAHHFREAREREPWTRYTEAASAQAAAAGDLTAAVVLLDDLLADAELPPSDLARVARSLGTVALNRRELVDEVYHQVVRTLRTVLGSAALTDRQKAEIRNPLGRLLILAGEASAALAELEQAVASLGHDPVEAARAMTYLGWAYAGPWPAPVHLRWLQRAAVMTTGVTSPADRLNLAGNRAAALLMLGEEEAWDVVAGLPLDGTAPAERLDLARIHTNIGTGALIWGRYPDAERHLAVAAGLADAEQAARLRHSVEVERANLDWYTGRWDGLVERSATLGQADPDRLTIYLASVRLAARLAAATGRRGAAEEQYRLLLDETSRLGAVDDTMEPAAALARFLLADGDGARALRVTDRPMELLHAKRVWVWAADIVPARVEAHLAVGDVAAARLLTGQLARGLRARTAPAARAALALCRAHLVAEAGDHAAAATAYARAARAWDAMPRPYDAALTRERQAEALLAARRMDEAARLLTDQYATFFRLGARGDASRLAARLRELGADVPRPWRGGRRGYGNQLSPRELDVVRLVAEGHTNREISRLLVKSPATVDQQLRAAMRKLKVTSRTALAVAAFEAGVLGPGSSVADAS